MDTVFLFSQYLNDEGCFCLKLNANGQMIASPTQRLFGEIKELQQDSNTVVIETTLHVSLLTLELSWLPERKARMAIPYALEEKLAQPVDELHFAFDKAHYHNNHYLIAIIEKQRLQYIMQLLTSHHIEFNEITLDWFALDSNQLVVQGSNLLVHSSHFKGALSGEMATHYLKKQPEEQLLLFANSQIPKDIENLPKNEDSSYLWIAKHILKTQFVNLCQGEFQHGNKPDWAKKSYQLATILFLFWLLSLIVTNAIHLFFLNKQLAKMETQIAVIYHEFFPDSKQVISPKFRIAQLLKDNDHSDQNRFWFLLNQFSKIENESFTLEQLRYQNKTLSVTLVSADFANLENIENQLKKLQLQVKQIQASNRDQQVVATLELK